MPQRTSKDRATNLGVFVLLLVFAAATVTPLLWMVFTSLKPLEEVEAGNLIPKVWHPENYSTVFADIPFARYYLNSAFIAIWVTYLTCLTSAMSAFAFARMEWRGRDFVFRLYLATMMVPGVVTMIPNFTLMVKLHLVDSFTGLIVPASFGAFGTFLLRQFMLTIPPALDEAATLDGAGPWNIFLDVVLPLARPGVIALAIFTFLASYGSFYWPLVMIKSQHLRTLPVGLMFFDSSYTNSTHLLMAASLMSLAPPIALFLVGQKYLVKGIVLGAVKG